MEIKYTPHYLGKLEEIFTESDYILRYEKGNFKAGYCLLKSTKVAVVNKYYPVEGKINALIEILRSVEISTEKMNDKNKKLFLEIITQPK